MVLSSYFDAALGPEVTLLDELVVARALRREHNLKSKNLGSK